MLYTIYKRIFSTKNWWLEYEIHNWKMWSKDMSQESLLHWSLNRTLNMNYPGISQKYLQPNDNIYKEIWKSLQTKKYQRQSKYKSFFRFILEWNLRCRTKCFMFMNGNGKWSNLSWNSEIVIVTENSQNANKK